MVSMRSTSKVVVPVLLLLATPALAQAPLGIGRAPTPAELVASSITIHPDGKGLPVGRGTFAEGAKLYVEQCESCHGVGGKGGVTSAPVLLAAKGPESGPWDRAVMAVKQPYPTIMWSFINRAMPYGCEGCLKPNEVYALTAYLLAINKVIPEDMVVDNTNLGKINTPMSREPDPTGKGGPNTWTRVPDWKPHAQRFPGYPG